MGIKIELLDGEHWAMLRDPKTITNRERRPIVELASTEELTVAQSEEMSNRLVALFVESWSFSFPLPAVNVESLDDLPALAVDQLRYETGSRLGDLVWSAPEGKATSTGGRSRKGGGKAA